MKSKQKEFKEGKRYGKIRGITKWFSKKLSYSEISDVTDFHFLVINRDLKTIRMEL